MLTEQKEKLSSFMDGELNDEILINEISQSEILKQSWHRYHMVRDTMRSQSHSYFLTPEFSKQVLNAIEFESLAEQPHAEQIYLPKSENLFWIKAKDIIGRISQVGLAACVTLAIIAGVQYQQDDAVIPVLNTVPIGINVAPVGGINNTIEKNEIDLRSIEQNQYNKIRLLVQDYELQKRLNAQ